MKPGFFDLTTPSDLLGKLEHDFQELTNNPVDTYSAFNFFVTATHLADWVCCGDRKKTKKMRKDHKLLQIADHLACGAKHFQLGNPAHTSVADAHRDAYVDAGYAQAGHCEEPLVVWLSTEEAEHVGAKELKVLLLAEKVLQFWKSRDEFKAT